MSRSYGAENVMNGTEGEVWIDGEYMAQVTAFKAVVKLEKQKVNQVKKLMAAYKVTGAEGSGSIKCNKISSFFIKKIADNIKKNKVTRMVIKAKLDDPDAWGAESVVVRDATFDQLVLADWEAGKLGEENYDFTFTDWEFEELVGER